MSEEILIPKIFVHEEFGEIRTFIKDGKILFAAVDVCAKLDIKNHRDALSDFNEDEKDVVTTDTLGGVQKILVVTEPGLYRLIFKSRKPTAKKFQYWVFHDVLPTLRKTGSYNMDENPNFGGNREYFPRDLSEKWLKEKTAEALIRIAKMTPSKELKKEILCESYFFLTDKELFK